MLSFIVVTGLLVAYGWYWMSVQAGKPDGTDENHE